MHVEQRSRREGDDANECGYDEEKSLQEEETSLEDGDLA